MTIIIGTLWKKNGKIPDQPDSYYSSTPAYRVAARIATAINNAAGVPKPESLVQVLSHTTEEIRYVSLTERRIGALHPSAFFESFSRFTDNPKRANVQNDDVWFSRAVGSRVSRGGGNGRVEVRPAEHAPQTEGNIFVPGDTAVVMDCTNLDKIKLRISRTGEEVSFPLSVLLQCFVFIGDTSEFESPLL